MTYYQQLLDYAWTLDIIDTHEHLPSEKTWVAEPKDILTDWLRHYFSCDLVSAGLTPADLETAKDSTSTKSLMERWELLAPAWHAAKNTGYGRSLDIAARGLYGTDGVNGQTIEELNEKFLAARQASADGSKSHYQYVLKEKSKISVSVLDGGPLPPKPEFFSPVIRLDWFLVPESVEAIRRVGAENGIAIHNLDDYKALAEIKLDKAIEKYNIAGLKSGLAYQRSLKYRKVPAHVADGYFCELLDGTHPRGVAEPAAILPQEFQDHMMHYILQLAEKRGLTFQFHTGLQEGNGNNIANSNPELMTNLFLEYPGVKFDIFHIGYPYQQTLSALCKNFSNVFIDMCWAHIISPEASVRAIVEWLDAVPANKISAFGGDYAFVDGVFGHASLARQNVARALAIKIDQGVFDLDRAMEILHWMFIDTPAKLFNLA